MPRQGSTDQFVLNIGDLISLTAVTPKQSQDMEHEPTLQMGSDRMLQIQYMRTTSHSRPSSLTSVNGRVGSTQTKKGAHSGIWTGPRPIKELVLACRDDA